MVWWESPICLCSSLSFSQLLPSLFYPSKAKCLHSYNPSLVSFVSLTPSLIYTHAIWTYIDDKRSKSTKQIVCATQSASQHLREHRHRFVRVELDLRVQSQSCTISFLSNCFSNFWAATGHTLKIRADWKLLKGTTCDLHILCLKASSFANKLKWF